MKLLFLLLTWALALPAFGYGLMASWVGLWAGYLAMIGGPLYEMWLGQRLKEPVGDRQ